MRTSIVACLLALATPLWSQAWRTWSHPPFLLQAGEAPLDTQAFDAGGHAAPFLVDLDADGRRDLVVGSIRGRFRFFANTGSDAAPRFENDSRWLLAEQQPAHVKNWCCMAAAPQFVDLDGDGLPDLTAGSYGGPNYWFRGLNHGAFKLPHQLLSFRGHSLLAREDIFSQRAENGLLDGQVASYAANIAWTKWDTDDKWDLLLGNHYGQLFVFRGNTGSYGPPGLPEFNRVSLNKTHQPSNEILIEGKKALPDGDYHAAPAVADWDGDGLWDILLGSHSGDVYLLRNTGNPGAPEFKTRELLIAGGQGMQWLAADTPPSFGLRSQVHAADFNGDGKVDLLVGCYAVTLTQRANLTSAESANLAALRDDLSALDREIGNVHREYPNKFVPYGEPENRTRFERTQALLREMHPYLATMKTKTEAGEAAESGLAHHGNVWVFLRK